MAKGAWGWIVSAMGGRGMRGWGLYGTVRGEREQPHEVGGGLSALRGWGLHGAVKGWGTL